MEELRRQGKAPKRGRWLLIGLILALLLASGVLWYRANLLTILEERFQEGLAHRQRGDYRQAVNVLSQLFAEHPEFARAPAALYQVAEIQDLYLARYDDALLAYLLLERDYPNADEVAPAQQQVAILYKYRLNDCSQAIVAYQKILDRTDGESAQLQYEIADCYFRLNNFEQARIEFEGLLKNHPESELAAEVQFRIAVTYALEGKLADAADGYRQVMERWAESPYTLEASFGLAAVYEEQEKLLEALKLLEGLAGRYPNPEILERKTTQVRKRISKKKNAI